MDNSLLAVRGINHKYIVVEVRKYMDKFLIVDGSNLFFQMFFGMPTRIVNDKGKAIQGTLGFVGALLKMIRKGEPTHILAVFDENIEIAVAK